MQIGTLITALDVLPSEEFAKRVTRRVTAMRRQDGVSKRFKDVEVSTDLPGTAHFTRWMDPKVESETAATRAEGFDKLLKEVQREADRLSNGNLTLEEIKAFEAVKQPAAKGNPQPVKPDVNKLKKPGGPVVGFTELRTHEQGLVG